ncbi:hypothetical protein GOBAR_AA04415 [Gossypium barbadense]|uniref:Transposase MuDR plant domain-containing protein n=1 Tax=Gossypium barbadense TaxID=3634 RepID=A0A2P5YKP2_GOSBA|nr:hypothetical protein GOBAR_AA04415 [Gossypium barbadense]
MHEFNNDPDLDEVLEDINDGDAIEGQDVHPFGQEHEYSTYLPDWGNLEFRELFISQQFDNKADCVFELVDYKVSSASSVYVEECWRVEGGCNWVRARTTPIQVKAGQT